MKQVFQENITADEIDLLLKIRMVLRQGSRSVLHCTPKEDQIKPKPRVTCSPFVTAIFDFVALLLKQECSHMCDL